MVHHYHRRQHNMLHTEQRSSHQQKEASQSTHLFNWNIRSLRVPRGNVTCQLELVLIEGTLCGFHKHSMLAPGELTQRIGDVMVVGKHPMRAMAQQRAHGWTRPPEAVETTEPGIVRRHNTPPQQHAGERSRVSE